MKLLYLFLFFLVITALIISAWLFIWLAHKGMHGVSLLGLGIGFFLCALVLGYLVIQYVKHPSATTNID